MWLASLLSVASAWEHSAVTFGWQADALDHPLFLDPDSFPADVGDVDDIEDAFVEGMETWHDGGAELQLVYGGRTSEGDALDGVLVTRFSEGPGDGYRLAVATSWGSGGQSIDCDILVFGENTALGPIAWTATGGAGVDLTEAITHEVGHCLGLAHSADPSAAMYAELRDERGLDDDDEEAVQALFGAACADGDGDGFGCDDCNDASVSTHPGAVEVCDGRVDVAGVLLGELGGRGASLARTGWGNAFDVDEDTVLYQGAQWLDLADDARVVWSVLRSTGGLGWERLVSHTEVVPAGVGWVDSPALDLPLEAGERYLFLVGVDGGAPYAYDVVGTSVGPITPVGVVATSLVPPDTFDAVVDGTWSTRQRLLLADPEAEDVCGGVLPEPVEPPAASGGGGCDCGGSSLSGPTWLGPWLGRRRGLR